MWVMAAVDGWGCRTRTEICVCVCACTQPVSAVPFTYHCHSTMPLLCSPGLNAPDFTALKREYKHKVIILCERRWKCTYPNIGKCFLPNLLLVCVARCIIVFLTLHFREILIKMPVIKSYFHTVLYCLLTSHVIWMVVQTNPTVSLWVRQ